MLEETLAGLPASVTVHEVSADNVASGLVETAAETGGVLLIGATRTRLLRQWVFGSTPDRVIELAGDAGVPVLVYAGGDGRLRPRRRRAVPRLPVLSEADRVGVEG